jgi:hypothetical protein
MASLKDKTALGNHDRAINRAHRNSNGPDLAARIARPPRDWPVPRPGSVP